MKLRSWFATRFLLCRKKAYRQMATIRTATHPREMATRPDRTDTRFEAQTELPATVRLQAPRGFWSLFSKPRPRDSASRLIGITPTRREFRRLANRPSPTPAVM